MRKLGWIVLVPLVLAGGCGDDDKGRKRPDAGVDGGSDADGAGCGIEIPAYEGYTDPLVWTEADLAACEAKCENLSSVECIQQNCANAAQFFTCIDEELYACQTSVGHDCYREYTEWNCCAYEGCSDEQPQDGFLECLQTNCSAENSTVEECYTADTASPSFVACQDDAYAACLSDMAAGTCNPDDAAPYGGYTGKRPWEKPYTAAELDACRTACKGRADTAVCLSEKCLGAVEYRQCVVDETAACSTLEGGECRDSWEGVFCCASENCSGAPTQADFADCLDAACKTQTDAFDSCDENSRAGTCNTSAETACQMQPVADGGVPDAGASDDSGTPAANTKLVDKRRVPTRATSHDALSRLRALKRAPNVPSKP